MQGLGLHGPVISQQAFIGYWEIFLGLWFLLQVSLSCGQAGHLPGSLAGNSLHNLYFQWHKQQHWYQHRATNTAGAGYPLQKGTWLRSGAWNPVQALPTKQFAWCGAVSSGRKGCLFSNWHKVTIWVSSSPFQSLGVSALWPSFQGLSSPSLFQSISICFNKYLTIPTLYQTLGLQWWTGITVSVWLS